jgi:DC-STAMP-like protein
VLTVDVAGEGVVADLCRDLVGVLKPLVKIVDVNFNPCLPQPQFPDYGNYKKIAILLGISWIILFIEPFSLRLRTVIMDHYYPQRANDRAVWLYQNVITKRISFFKFARLEIFRRLSKNQSFKTRSCFEILRAKFDNFWICRKICGYNKDFACMLCGDQQSCV